MKLVFVYDSDELKKSASLCDYAHILTGQRKLLYDVAEGVLRETGDESSLIFINQYLDCADASFEWRQRNAGIALIKFLRMMGVKHPIVLITPFDALELVKLNPTNLIVTSKGITCTKYLHEFFEKNDLEKLQTLTADQFDEKQDLMPYILAEFRLPEDERHNWANWWGIDRLWNIHRVVEREKFTALERWELKEYPSKLKEKLNDLKNRQALFIYGHKEEKIEYHLEDLHKEVQSREQNVVTYENAIDEIGKKIAGTEDQIKEAAALIEKITSSISYNLHTLPQSNGDSNVIREKKKNDFEQIVALFKKKSELSTLMSQLILQRRSVRKGMEWKNESYADAVASLNEEEARVLERFKKKLDAIEEFVTNTKSQINKSSVEALRADLQNKKPRILYIDDQASEGWSNIFQYIIYGTVSSGLFNDKIQPEEGDKINREYFTQKVLPEVIEFKPDLVLLDLRLNKESGIRLNIEELSGAVLLREIRKEFPGLPVLITTASNKSWSYEFLQNIGCDAYWTKEGIDMGMDEKDSVKNYLRFIELVNILASSEYGFLKWFSDEIEKIKSNSSRYWWETSKYAKDGKVDKQDILKILAHSLFIVREYLRNEVVNPFKKEQSTSWLLPSFSIHNLGKVFELIYNTYSSDFMYDNKAQELYKQRNHASHIVQGKDRKTAESFSFEDSKNYIKETIEYLNLSESPPLGEPKTLNVPPGISPAQLKRNIEITRRRK